MSLLGKGRSDVTDDVVLVFRPPENPAAQIAGITRFKSLRLKLDEQLDRCEGRSVDWSQLCIDGANRSRCGEHRDGGLRIHEYVRREGDSRGDQKGSQGRARTRPHGDTGSTGRTPRHTGKSWVRCTADFTEWRNNARQVHCRGWEDCRVGEL